MAKGIPNNGINKGWFKKGLQNNPLGGFEKGHDPWNKGTKGLTTAWNKGLHGIQSMEKHPQWINGKARMANGYMRHRINRSYKLEHRYFIEQQIGRNLTEKEVVHHIDGDRDNNRLENLMLFPNHSEHMKFHWQQGFIRKSRKLKS